MAAIDFFKKGKIVKGINHTNLRKRHEGRPIALCNGTLYKIITKIMVMRMHPVLTQELQEIAKGAL